LLYLNIIKIGTSVSHSDMPTDNQNMKFQREHLNSGEEKSIHTNCVSRFRLENVDKKIL